MIEPIMFVGIGFLVASLLVIGVIPLVHARAVRLTMRRLEAADAAVDGGNPGRQGPVARRIRHVDAAARNERRADEGEDHEPARRDRQEERGDRPAQARARREDRGAVRARGQGKAAQRRAARRRATSARSRPTALAEAERALARRRPSSRRSAANLDERLGHRRQPARRAGGVARADRGRCKGQIESYEKETTRAAASGSTARPARPSDSASSSPRSAARSRQLGNRVAELERQLVAQTTEAEILGRRVQELVARLDEQGRFLAEREYVVATACAAKPTAAQKTEADLRAELAEAENRQRAATEALATEKALLEDQLKQSQEERAKLQREIAAMKREAESHLGGRAHGERAAARAHQRRRRRGGAAHRRARRTGLADRGHPRRPTPAAPGGARQRRQRRQPRRSRPTATSAKGTLADRIRALQSRASRVPQPSGA